MIEAIIGPSGTPIRRREPSMPNCGPGWQAQAAGRSKSRTRRPVRPRTAKTPPTAMVRSAATSVPMASSGKAMSTSARRQGPGLPGSGSAGTSTGSSGRTASTRAAQRARTASVSPGSAVKVPVDWSDAILAASASGSPAVSMR